MSEMPLVGAAAPDFEGTTSAGETVRLSDFAGRAFLLYFYPKDDTPGCTKQACNLRDGMGELREAGIAVVGVSPDDSASHERFEQKYDLTFPLLADTDHAIMERYGVWGERTLYGRKVVGVKRTSFLIDGDGKVRHVFKRPKTAAHTEEVLQKARKAGVIA